MLLVSSLVQAQSSNKDTSTVKTGIITRTILDETLPYVNIVIRDLNDKIITGSITKDDGSFYMDNIPKGTTKVSKVSIEYLG